MSPNGEGLSNKLLNKSSDNIGYGYIGGLRYNSTICGGRN